MVAHRGRAERREDQVACWRRPQLGEELPAEHLVALDDAVDELGMSTSCKSLWVHLSTNGRVPEKKMFSFRH